MYLSPSAQLGGAERSLLDVLASIRAAQPSWELHLVASGDGPLLARVRELDVAATVVAFPPGLARLGDAAAGGPAGSGVSRLALLRRMCAAAPATMKYARALRRALAALAPDIVQTNGFKMHVLGTVATALGTPVVWHVHDHVSQRPVMARVLRWRVRRCAAVVANSHSVARDARTVCGPGVSITPIYNAVDLERFAPGGRRLDLDALAGLPPAAVGTVRVGLVATLARWKGHELFLNALATLPRETPVRAYIIGGPMYETDGSQHSLDSLRRFAGALGLGDRVGITGYVDDSAAAMRALDVVVHASTQPEPFGLVIAEGMACGRAVIVSYAGGAAELVEGEVDALTHAPGDAAGLAACILRLAADGELRTRLGARARVNAEHRFAGARLATEFDRVYAAVTMDAASAN